MNRRTRRKLGVVATAAAVGVLSPVWGPLVLRNVPIFGVEEVRVVGTRFVADSAVRALAGFGPDASVWDDMTGVERRVAEHPLVLEADVRRSGLHRLDLVVHEVQPVAFVSTPALVPVNADGLELEIDPAKRPVDLPILQGAEVSKGRVEPETARRALDVLEQVSTLDSAFARQISELRPASASSVEFVLLPDSPLERVVLPFRDPVTAFRRVGSAISLAEARGPVRAADARYENEVVIRMGQNR
jgi:cell division septal protein FtsQ